MKFPEYFTADCFRDENETVIEEKIRALLWAMTNEEKAELCHGGINPPKVGQVGNGGYLKGVPRLGVPEIRMYDGPAGVTSIYETTGLPAEEMLASSWSRELAERYGSVTGSENRMISGNCQLGAEVDLVRTTHFNRTRDMLGEDPYLAGELAIPLVRGIQKHHVMAVLKHFAGYIISVDPADTADMVIDEQTMQELYLKPFERCIHEAGALGVMTTYSRINGPYAANAEPLISDVLRNQWGYRGLTMCDWGGNHSFSLAKGMDMEMPMGAYNSTERILKFLDQGKLSQETLDTAAGHVLYALGKAGYLSLVTMDEKGRLRTEEGRTSPISIPDTYGQQTELRRNNARIAEEIAVKGAVLLKNEQHTLPITGQDCSGQGDVALVGFGGSYAICGYGQERAYGTLGYMRSPLEALKELSEYPEAFQAQIGIDYAGVSIESRYLYTDAEGESHGLIRYYGISQEDGYRPPLMSLSAGGAGEEFFGIASRDEEEDEEGSLDFRPMELFMPGSDAADMEGKETGTICCIDETLEFTCEKGNYTWKNQKDGKAFPKGNAYAWKGYIQVEEDGEYQINLQGIGGVVVCKMDLDGTGYQDMGAVKLREGTQWPWGNLACTPEGMEICATRVELKAKRRYPILIYGKALLKEKDLQIRLAWVTPDMKRRQRQEAVLAASKAKKTIYFVHQGFQLAYGQTRGGMNFAEGTDLTLEQEQEDLLHEVAGAVHAHGGKLIVAAYNGSAFAMKSWVDEADALLYLWMPGQSGSRALAKLLLGQESPSGKLPQSFPDVNENTLVTDTLEHKQERWEGIKEEGKPKRVYASEGIFTGYRWYDKENRKPLFPFGHGLTYTTFAYSDLTVEVKEEITVTLTVENTGSRTGTEIVQLYLGQGERPSYAMMPVKQLCGFARLEDLAPGEKRTVTIRIPKTSFFYWDIKAPFIKDKHGYLSKWKKAGGSRKILVGASAEDIRLEGSIQI